MLFCYFLLSLYGASCLSLQPFEVSNNTYLESRNKPYNLLMKIKSNPEQFMQAAQNLEPAAIREIITLLETLREESESKESGLESELTDAQNNLNDANTAETDAIDVLEAADKAVLEAKQALAAAEQHQTDSSDDLDEKKEDHKAKQLVKDAKKEVRDKEVPSLDSDQHVLTQVIDMLEGLHAKHSERFLAITEARSAVGGVGWGCLAATYALDLNSIALNAGMIDGNTDSDTARTCDGHSIIDLGESKVWNGKIRYYFNAQSERQAQAYSMAYSSDGVNFKRFGDCSCGGDCGGAAAALGPLPQPPNHWDVDTPEEAFRYFDFSTACWNTHIREVQFITSD